ncbi:MAG: hypothetical protein OXC05_02320, partial [Halieaceae bacterium]|nr:hypothetical protein [Halieaceae bacterium]
CLIAGGGCEKSHSLCPPVYITGRWNSPLGERGVKVPVDCNLLLETTPLRCGGAGLGQTSRQYRTVTHVVIEKVRFALV